MPSHLILSEFIMPRFSSKKNVFDVSSLLEPNCFVTLATHTKNKDLLVYNNGYNKLSFRVNIGEQGVINDNIIFIEGKS